MSLVLLVAASVCTVLGLAFLLLARGASRRRRWQRAVVAGLGGLLLVTLGALFATVSLSIRGYRALTHEEVAATVRTFPTGPQRFRARVSYPDGREEIFDLSGDAIYVDAHILKWRPWVNLLGLHTAYELDRVAGRYRAIEQERSAVRTVHSLGRERPVDLFGLRQRYEFLAPLLDAEYGSATFVPVTRPAELELRVSTSGLLIRDAQPMSN